MKRGNRFTFSVTFYCRKSKVRRDGQAAIEMGIVSGGERTYIALPMTATPADFRKKIASPRSNPVKDLCEAYRVRVHNIVTELVSDGYDVTVSSVRERLLGRSVSSMRVSDLFAKWLDENKSRIGSDLSLSVFRKYQLVRDCFIEFAGDALLGELEPSVISSFYAKLTRVYKEQTAAGYITKLKTVFKYGLQNRMLKDDLFVGLRVKRRLSDVEFLTSEELSRIEAYDSDIDRIVKVRDMFLFMCYTGLSYCDMADFKKEDAVKCEGGYMLSKERIKTGIGYTVFLLPKAISILDKYDWTLPVVSNQKLNSYLREIKDVCGIRKPLHCHIARHTFATQMLNKGLSIDIVAKILGHSSTRLTVHYAKILDKSVINAMKNII